MKISLTNIAKMLSMSMIMAAVTLLATQSTVNAVTVKLAQANMQQDLTNITSELTRRTDELKKTSTALNGQTGSNNAATTGTESKECAKGDSKTQAAIDKANKDSTKATNDIQALLSKTKQANTAAATQQAATETDAEFGQYKVANTQANIMNAVCTQKDAQAQLNQLIEQSKQKLSQQQSESGTDGSSSGGSGDSSSIDLQSLITKAIQIAIAVAAIIASIVALVMAIQSGDYAAAAAILVTLVGQLTTVANLLSEAISSLSGSGESSS